MVPILKGQKGGGLEGERKKAVPTTNYFSALKEREGQITHRAQRESGMNKIEREDESE